MFAASLPPVTVPSGLQHTQTRATFEGSDSVVVCLIQHLTVGAREKWFTSDSGKTRRPLVEAFNIGNAMVQRDRPTALHHWNVGRATDFVDKHPLCATGLQAIHDLIQDPTLRYGRPLLEVTASEKTHSQAGMTLPSAQIS